MKKNLFAVIFFFVFVFLCLTLDVYASSEYVIFMDTNFIRKGPATSYDKLGLENVGSTYLIKNNEAVKNIFKSMKEINDKEYLAIKMLELFLFLKNYFSQYFIDEYKIMNSITDDIVKNIKDDVIKNLNKRIYIKTLSKKYGLSESTIKNKFRTIYGETLYSYIKKQKMHKASLLILSNKMKIIDIALELGYSNASKFAKAFKDIYGVTPSEYRKVN